MTNGSDRARSSDDGAAQGGGASPDGALLDAIAFDERGLVPVVAQDAGDGAVLMVAFADRAALARTLATGQAHYFSRARGAMWRKGETSGHVQRVLEVRYDCDADTVLYRVEQTGPACHTGARSCFFRGVSLAGAVDETSASDGAGPSGATGIGATGIGAVMALLEQVVNERLATLPEGSYVRQLHERGVGYVAQKVVEEAGESVVAALQGQDDELVGESADLLFHLTVLLRERGVAWDDVAARLLERHAARPR